MDVIILVGGKGKKIWPYSEIRNKSMIPISNKPLLYHTVEAIKRHQVENIFIVGDHCMEEINHFFRNEPYVKVIKTPELKGSTLAFEYIPITDDFICLFGDCLVEPLDLDKLFLSNKNTILLSDQVDHSHDYIIANYKGDDLECFIAHPRGYEKGHFMIGGYFKYDFLECIKYNKGRFTNTKVGIGSPNEFILEESINDYLNDHKMKCILASMKCVNIDKPWDILRANRYHNEYELMKLRENCIDASVTIDESALITGSVIIGKGSIIGRNVTIEGPVFIGENTKIDNGAVIGKYSVIGDECILQNYCKVGEYSSIGNYCIVEQTAEFLGGVLMNKNYLYHHGEFYGICGERCDLGAGTVCGTLRFDDGETIHNIDGRREYPTMYSNATYLGDFTRTGVGTIFLPGATVGINSVIGPGSIISGRIESNKLVYPKQELIQKEWGYKKYGW